MFAAARISIGFLSARERITYFALVTVRALVGILDVFGILLVGFVASIGATQLDSSTTGPTVLFGIQVPEVDSDGLLGLVVFTLVVFVVKAFIAIGLSRAITAFIARIEARNANALADHLLRGSLERAKRLSKAEFQYAITESTVWSFTGLLNNVANIASESFLLLVVAIAFFVVNPVVAVFAILYFVLILLIMQAFIGRVLKRAGNDAASGAARLCTDASAHHDRFQRIAARADHWRTGKRRIMSGRAHRDPPGRLSGDRRRVAVVREHAVPFAG